MENDQVLLEKGSYVTGALLGERDEDMVVLDERMKGRREGQKAFTSHIYTSVMS